MPSANYNYNGSAINTNSGNTAALSRQNFSYGSQAGTFRQRTLENYNTMARQSLAQPAAKRESSQKMLEGKLKRLQKTNMGKNITKAATGRKNPLLAAISVAFNLLAQIRLSVDWCFVFLLIPFAFLKDIVDIAFAGLIAAATGTIVLGPVVAGAGMAVSFIANLMLQILSVTCLLIVGANLKNRGLAKFIAVEMLEFLAESFPGLGWLPWAAIFAMILYLMVLLDRYLEKEESKKVKKESGGEQNEQFTTTASHLLGKA